jgi:hypothetical protein
VFWALNDGDDAALFAACKAVLDARNPAQ